MIWGFFFLLTACAMTENTYDLSQKEIDQIVKSHLPEIHSCYKGVSAKQAKVGGKFTLSWLVNNKGQVENEKVVSADPAAQAIAECALSSLKQWQFPALGGDRTANIEYPFSVKISE
jgi:hypothetical protein